MDGIAVECEGVDWISKGLSGLSHCHVLKKDFVAWFVN
jgi:hypothetical protein